MEDAAKGDTTTADNSSAPEGVLTRLPSDSGAEQLDSADVEEKKSYSADDFDGLFGDESKPTEEELQGIEPAEPKKEEPQEKKEEPPDSEAKGEEKAEEPKEEVKEEEPKEPDKPPAGFVPHQALTEARNQIKALREEIQTLKERPPESVKPPPSTDDSKWKDFKVLSDDEFSELVEDDPTEALKYQNKLRQFERYAEAKEQAQRQQTEAQKRTESFVREWTGKISEAVPGIYDEGSEVGRQLAVFAEEMGFDDPTYLETMTDPRTLIVPPGSNQSYVLGPGAAGLIKLLANAKKKISSAADQKKLREEITKELEPQILERVTKELTAKFKGTAGYKSLTTVPGGGEEVTDGTILSETEWAKLPKEKREKLLSGE